MQGHGVEKLGDARLITSSANRAWSLLSAELRSHPAGEIGAFTPQNALITQTIRDTNFAFSIRGSGGVRQKVVATPGTIWLCPAGIREEVTQLSGDMPEVLHVYLPPHSFLGAISESHASFRAQDLRYQAPRDESRCPSDSLSKDRSAKLNDETSSGGLRMDTLAVELIGVLARDHAEVSRLGPPVWALAKGASTFADDLRSYSGIYRGQP